MIFGGMNRSGGQRYSDAIVELSESNTITQYIPADKKGHWRDDNVTLVQHIIWNTKESRNDQCPTTANDGSGIVVTSWARIDNRDELGSKLDLNANDSSLSDSYFILKSYQKWGEDCVLHLIGDFVFVIYDKCEQKIFCARDHMGVRPFYYHLSDTHFIFASGLNVFVELPGFEPEKSQKWMAEYLVGLSMSFTETAYTNIKKLAPAHCLIITSERHKLRQYFQFSPETTLKLKDSREYVEVYRELLEEAIRCRVRSDYKIGTELSGGIDSSTVTAYASLLMSQPEKDLHSFSFIDFEQESKLIHSIINNYKLVDAHFFSYAKTFYLKQKGMLRALGILGYPVEHVIGVWHESFYVGAEELNIRTLLSGFGGDEFVTSSAGLVLVELLYQKRFIQLYKNLHGSPIIRLLRILKKIANYPEHRNQMYNPIIYAALSQRWPFHLVRKDLVDKYDLQKRFIQRARMDSGYTRLNDYILGNRWAPFVSTRMENGSLMAAARKIEYRWPLLDVRLVKLFLSIPSKEKYANGMGRLLHRKAVNNIIPEEVVWKPSKYMGVLQNPGCMYQSQEESVDDLHLELLGMIDRKKLLSNIERIKIKPIHDIGDTTFQIEKILKSLRWLNQWLQ